MGTLWQRWGYMADMAALGEKYFVRGFREWGKSESSDVRRLAQALELEKWKMELGHARREN